MSLIFKYTNNGQAAAVATVSLDSCLVVPSRPESCLLPPVCLVARLGSASGTQIYWTIIEEDGEMEMKLDSGCC